MTPRLEQAATDLIELCSRFDSQSGAYGNIEVLSELLNHYIIHFEDLSQKGEVNNDDIVDLGDKIRIATSLFAFLSAIHEKLEEIQKIYETKR